MDIFVMFQGMRQNSFQTFIQLESSHISTCLGQGLGKSAYACTDFHDRHMFSQFRCFRNGSYHVRADKEILSQLMFGMDAETADHILHYLAVCKIGFQHQASSRHICSALSHSSRVIP